MRKRIRLFYVVVMAFVIVAGGLMTLNRLDQEIAVLQDTARETRLNQLALEAENGSMKQEIAVMDTESYIRKMARKDNRFLMPGEVRFVVVNPEALYAPGEMPGQEVEVAIDTEIETEPATEDAEGCNGQPLRSDRTLRGCLQPTCATARCTTKSEAARKRGFF